MTSLTLYQCECIDTYVNLVASHPHLFEPRLRRKLILDPEKLRQFTLENDQAMGVIAQTPFFLYINDLVSFDEGKPHAYSRVIGKQSLEGAEGVVVIPIIDNGDLGIKGNVVLLEQERHSLGEFMIELPRGFAEHETSPEVQAIEELESETGYRGKAISVGRSYTDSGSTNSVVNFVLVLVNERRGARPEETELVERVFNTSIEKAWEQVRTGEIRDGFTIQGLALYERYLLDH